MCFRGEGGINRERKRMDFSFDQRKEERKRRRKNRKKKRRNKFQEKKKKNEILIVICAVLYCMEVGHNNSSVRLSNQHYNGILWGRKNQKKGKTFDSTTLSLTNTLLLLNKSLLLYYCCLLCY